MTWTKQQRAMHALTRKRIHELERRAAEIELARRMLAAVLSARSGRMFSSLFKALQAIDLPLDGLWLEEARRVLEIADGAFAAVRAGRVPSGARNTVN